MANVSIKFNNKEFLLSCEDGQEEHLEELLIHINQKLENSIENISKQKNQIENEKNELEIKNKEILKEHRTL